MNYGMLLGYAAIFEGMCFNDAQPLHSAASTFIQFHFKGGFFGGRGCVCVCA